MSNSLDYILKRNIDCVDMKEAYELPLKVLFVEQPTFPIIETLELKDENSGNPIIRTVINYNPNADFNYYTNSHCMHDGTLLFKFECACRCVNKVFNIQTYNVQVGEPKAGDMAVWTIGNPIIVSEHGKQFATEEKPWIQERTIAFLPIKYEVRKMGFRNV